MSEQQNQPQKGTKKPKDEIDKKNTDAWKQKQAQKKKEKQQKQALGAAQQKQDKKEKKKKQKGQQPQVKEQAKKQETVKDKKGEQLAKKQGQKIQEDKKVEVVSKKYKKISTIQSMIVSKYPELLENRSAQIELIEKQMLSLIKPGDTILYIGKFKVPSSSKLSPGSGRNNYRLLQIPGMTEYPDSQILCRYEDTPFLLSEQVTKVLIQGLTIFQNGSCLVQKGLQSLCMCAKYYNKPIIVTSGSWNYTNESITNYRELAQAYGEDIINKYDFVDAQSIDFVCMEFGVANASNIRYQVEQGYKDYGYETVKW